MNVSFILRESIIHYTVCIVCCRHKIFTSLHYPCEHIQRCFLPDHFCFTGLAPDQPISRMQQSTDPNYHPLAAETYLDSVYTRRRHPPDCGPAYPVSSEIWDSGIPGRSLASHWTRSSLERVTSVA